MFNWSDIVRPIVALSPMADMTDSPFCRIAKRLGAPVVFREMISADGLTYGSEKSLRMGAFEEEERPIVQQLFGAHAGRMGDAVRLIEETYRPDGFDVNMGCPVYKITSNFNGAALMREPATAAAVVRAMKKATRTPVSVKLRLGWSDPSEILEFIKVIEDAGADLVTVHGRTKEQAYAGAADWTMVGRAKGRVRIPVLVNGDIFTGDAAKRALGESGCDGVLVARGALGNPWVFREIAAALRGEPAVPPSLEERVRVIKEHAALHAAQYGNLVAFRKHLTWYFKGIAGIRPYKERLMAVSYETDLVPLLDEIAANAGR